MVSFGLDSKCTERENCTEAPPHTSPMLNNDNLAGLIWPTLVLILTVYDCNRFQKIHICVLSYIDGVIINSICIAINTNSNTNFTIDLNYTETTNTQLQPSFIYSVNI